MILMRRCHNGKKSGASIVCVRTVQCMVYCTVAENFGSSSELLQNFERYCCSAVDWCVCAMDKAKVGIIKSSPSSSGSFDYGSFSTTAQVIYEIYITL